MVAEIKAVSRGDLTIGGPTLAAEAFRLDLVDVVELLWCPVLLGGGIPVLSAGVRRDLRLRSERRFSNGVVQATYDVIGQARREQWSAAAAVRASWLPVPSLRISRRPSGVGRVAGTAAGPGRR